MSRPRTDTVIIFTTQPDTLADFYGTGLELDEPNRMGDRHVGFNLPDGTYLGFDRIEEAPPRGGGTSVWFDVDDLEATYERFVAAGAEVRYPPSLKPMGDVLASLIDPEGNVFGLVSR